MTLESRNQLTYGTARRPARNNGRKWLGALLCAAGILLLLTLLPERTILPQDKVTQSEIAALHPVVESSKDLLIEQAADQGISIIIPQGYRSAEEQNRLYEQGRVTEGNIVTYAEAGESYHNYGLAIDFALMSDSGEVLWDLEYDGNGNGTSDWMEVVEIAKALGFEWGGDWDNPDYPHLQMSFGLSIRELQRGKEPPVE